MTHPNDRKPASPFSARPLVDERGLAARVFRTAQPDLARQALENIFAIRAPDAVSTQEVAAIYRQHNLGPNDVQNVAAGVWRTALTAFVEDDVLSQSELDYLNTLRRLLDVSEDLVMAAESEIVYPRFRAAVGETLGQMLAQGVTPELNQRLGQLVKDFRLPESDQRRVLAEAGSAFLETTMARLTGVRRLTELEHTTLVNIIKAFQLPVDDDTHARISAYYLMWRFENGQQIEPQAVPVNLHKQEICLFSFDVAWASARAQELGKLYVTSERVVFEGGLKNAAITYQSLLGVQWDGAYLALRKATGPAVTVQFALSELAELAVVVIERALADRSRSSVANRRPLAATVDQPIPPSAPPPPTTNVDVPSTRRQPGVVNQRKLDELLDDLHGLIGLAPVK